MLFLDRVTQAFDLFIYRKERAPQSQKDCTIKIGQQLWDAMLQKKKSDLPVNGLTSLNMCTPQCLQKALRVNLVLKTRYERLFLPSTAVWSPCR